MVKIEISNRLLYTLITAFILVNVIAIGLAVVDTSKGWHDASQIDTTSGFAVEGGQLDVSGNIVSTGSVQATSITATTGDVCTSTNCLNNVAGGVAVSQLISVSSTFCNSRGCFVDDATAKRSCFDSGYTNFISYSRSGVPAQICRWEETGGGSWKDCGAFDTYIASITCIR